MSGLLLGLSLALALARSAPPPESASARPSVHAATLAGKAGAAADPNKAAPQSTFAETLVVTATTVPESSDDLPYTVHALSHAALRAAAPRTLPEALRELPAVAIQKTSHGQGSAYIRGFTGFRTLYLLDGIRLNHSAFREGPNQYAATIDPLAAARIEVVKGPSSALYGSDAIGGTVSRVSEPLLGALDDGGLSGRFSTRYASAEHSQIGRLEVAGGVAERFAFRLGASLKEFGDLESGGGRAQEKSGYDEWEGDLRAEWRLRPEQSLVFAAERAAVDDAWRTHATIYGTSFEGTAIGTDLRRVLDQRRTLGYVQYHDGRSRRLFDRFSASLSFQEQEEDEDRVRASGTRNVQGFSVGTLGSWLRFEKASRLGLWSYGLEAYRDQVDSFGKRFDAAGNLTRVEIQGPVADDSTYDLLGLYLQDQISVGDRIDILFGARATEARAEAGRMLDPVSGAATSTSGRWRTVVGNLRALVRLDTGGSLRLFGGISQGFRAPNLSDLTRLDSARSGELEVPSPDLDPERFLAFELGLKAHRDRFHGELALFRTEIEGLIVRVPTGREIDGEVEVEKRNAGDGFIHGVELSAEWALARAWTLRASGSWLQGEVDTFPTSAPEKVREPIDKLMPPTGEISLRWQGERRGLWAEGILRAAGRQGDLSTADRADRQRIPPGGTPGYTVATLRLGGELRERLDWTVALENLTDEEYRIHGSGVNEPGRNLVAALEVGF